MRIRILGKVSQKQYRQWPADEAGTGKGEKRWGKSPQALAVMSEREKPYPVQDQVGPAQRDGLVA